MKSFPYNTNIVEKDKPTADRKMKALSTIGSNLTTTEAEKLAHMLLHNPVKTEMAKKALGV